MKRHGRENFFVVGEGVIAFDEQGAPATQRPSTTAQLRKFRFSRMGPKGKAHNEQLRIELANAMTAEASQLDSDDPIVPAGFTYLGQFIDHDLTFDRTSDLALGDSVEIIDLIQGRSPALDLDCLYGLGSRTGFGAKFYVDGIRLKTGTTAATSFPDAGTNVDIDGFDLPRSGNGSSKAERRKALIPDPRNDENLAVAQTHLAFIRFHNRVVEDLAGQGTPSTILFRKARVSVVRHYQWMIRHDFLPRIVDNAILDDVFTNGRKFFEPAPLPGDAPTMPVEFSVAAYRLGHSMIRGAYRWNRVFRQGGPGPIASLDLLFRFSGTSGTLSPDGDLNDPESGGFESLPTNWIADFRRLYDFKEAGRSDLAPEPDSDLNITKRIDSLLVDPLKELPLGSFGGHGTTPPAHELNLAFRNLTRALMVGLASGQQMAELMEIPALADDQILGGSQGAVLDALAPANLDAVIADTPLWFYILREAELNNGRLTGVGGRIVAEVFHRAMEGSRISILRTPTWRPSLGPDANTFRMTDLLLFAFEGNEQLLNPLGD